MKRLLVVASLCATTLTCATSKNDLASAIRSLNVATVQQIVTHEKFTQREYDCYLDLANELVFDRELWTRKLEIFDDVTTPYKPVMEKVSVRGLIGYLLIGLGIWVKNDPRLKNYEDYGVGVIGLGASIIAIQMIWAVVKMGEKQREALRKKYDDAVAIKQLIYMANIVEA